jgi:hypothetical protein
MSVYRVGPHGATVYGPDGEPLLRLMPGLRLVEHVHDETETDRADRRREPGKRIPAYADKRIASGRDLADKGAPG